MAGPIARPTTTVIEVTSGPARPDVWRGGVLSSLRMLSRLPSLNPGRSILGFATMERSTIAIIGAGIGGLTLAIALRRLGIDATLFEQTGELREIGAAVALSANATRVFERFGLGDELAEHGFEVSDLIYRDGRDGQVIARHAAGDTYRARYGAPYVGIHRADLQQTLSGAAGMERIRLGRRLVGIDDEGAFDGGPARLRFDDGSKVEADLVIGADGARSFMRQWMLGYDDALYSGCSGFRGIVPRSSLAALPDPTAIQYWVGPHGHLLHYPIGSGDINFLLVERSPSPWPARDWKLPARPGEQLDRFADWHPAVVEMISAVPTSARWGLFHRPPLNRWSRGRVVLLGDAAHALVPHHGQGANQSVEDAVVLAGCLAQVFTDQARTQQTGRATNGPAAPRLLKAVRAYEALRIDRTRRVQYASITTADVLHLPDGAMADARNARLASAERMTRHLDWIHAFRA